MSGSQLLPAPILPAPILLASVLLGISLACGCSGQAEGPRQRVREFTRCVVPSTAVRFHESVDGSETTVARVKVVMAEPLLADFLESCGYGELDAGFNGARFGRVESLEWWDPRPEMPLARGATLAPDATSWRSQVLVVPRDTDLAVYVQAQMSGADR